MLRFPYRGPYNSLEGNQPSYFALGTHFSTDNQFFDMDFHPWKFNLMLIIVLLEQHYNNPNHTRQTMPSHWANAHEGRAVRPRVGEASPPHLYKPLGILSGSLPHRQEPFRLFTKNWGQVNFFSLAAGARSPSNFKPS